MFFICRLYQAHIKVTYLTNIKLWNVENFPSLYHVFPFYGKLHRVCALARRDELWTQKPTHLTCKAIESRNMLLTIRGCICHITTTNRLTCCSTVHHWRNYLTTYNMKPETGGSSPYFSPRYSACSSIPSSAASKAKDNVCTFIDRFL